MRPFFGVGSDVMTSLLVKKNQRRAFSAAEDLKLIRLVQLKGQDNWDSIASYMEGRSARACRERWRFFLSPGLTNGPWSHEEDALLISLFNQLGPKWKQISTHFNGRSECNVKNRWTRHLKQMIQDEKNSQAEKPSPTPDIEKEISSPAEQAEGDGLVYPLMSVFPETDFDLFETPFIEPTQFTDFSFGDCLT